MDEELRKLIAADVAAKTTDLTKEYGFVVFFTSVEARARCGKQALEVHAGAIEEFREKNRALVPVVQVAQQVYDGPKGGFNESLSPPPGLYYLFCWKLAEVSPEQGASLAARVAAQAREIYAQAGVEGVDVSSELNNILLWVYPNLKDEL
ncbi:hypothetical protein [Ralstonia pseudosolanacearum]|uniref:hypothetical protein n=1 Tax=Ralstonia pseudosolanacearum TaxID=1310165 RepID=UPI003CECCD5D